MNSWFLSFQNMTNSFVINQNCILNYKPSGALEQKCFYVNRFYTHGSKKFRGFEVNKSTDRQPLLISQTFAIDSNCFARAVFFYGRSFCFRQLGVTFVTQNFKSEFAWDHLFFWFFFQKILKPLKCLTALFQIFEYRLLFINKLLHHEIARFFFKVTNESHKEPITGLFFVLEESMTFWGYCHFLCRRDDTTKIAFKIFYVCTEIVCQPN